MAPRGRATKPTPKTTKVDSSAAVESPSAKKLAAMKVAKNA